MIVCNALKGHFKRLCTKNPEIEWLVIRMMSQIYIFLQKSQNNGFELNLENIPFVLIKEQKIFVTPEHVVLDINLHEEIPPYLCKASLYFGQFHSLFEKSGAGKSLKCSHLANVLFEIWTKSKGAVLEPNEMHSSRKAVQILFSKLKTENVVELNVSVLYLPSKKNTLIQSSELVFIDDRLLERRIGHNMPEMNFFVGFKELCIHCYDRSHFTQNVYQRGTRHGRHQSSYRQSDDYFSQFFSRGSQPGQARRWYRQAEFDFKASTSDKHQPGAYNWACYKSHQVKHIFRVCIKVTLNSFYSQAILRVVLLKF